MRALRTMTESRINYGLSYAIDFACPVGLCWEGSRVASDWTMALLAFCIGGAIFSFVEYALHRWYFHAQGTFAAAMHRAHHRSPTDPMALPCFSSAAVSLALWLMLPPLLGPAVASFFLGGLLSGYFIYATLHHVHHRTRRTSASLRWLRPSRLNHAVHHSCPNKNFGVTSLLWDRVFGTYADASHRAPRKPLLSLARPPRKSCS
jgi:sterol desaturase/sphingolipid hydroxylase (fatty acid hydroxylase superfamily)